MSPGNTPIIVGVGDIKNPSLRLEDAFEPADLILRAIHAAIKDTRVSNQSSQRLQESIDSIDVVRTWTWEYPDLPGLLSEKLGVQPKHKYYCPTHGGNSPARLLDEAARRISLGESKVAIVTGGEALASCISINQGI